jgi:DNA repair/transcription protein MET18/MMS19
MIIGLSYTLPNIFILLVAVLVNFYCNRLSDPASVPNLMTGFVALTSKFDHFTKACTQKVLESLVNVVHIQSFAHITRNGAYQVFENLLDYHSEGIN